MMKNETRPASKDFYLGYLFGFVFGACFVFVLLAVFYTWA